jgi:hypothetical protein
LRVLYCCGAQEIRDVDRMIEFRKRTAIYPKRPITERAETAEISARIKSPRRCPKGSGWNVSDMLRERAEKAASDQVGFYTC